MLNLNRRHVVLVAASFLCAWGLLSSSVHAQSSIYAQSGVGVTNSQNGINAVGQLDFDGNETGAPTHAQATQQFTGLDGNGNTQTMTFTGENFSSAQYGQLHSSSTGTVTNTYYNASNPAYFNYPAYTFDPSGSPDGLGALGFAGFTDTLHFSGTQPGDQVNFKFHVDGTNSGDGSVGVLDFTVTGNTDENFTSADTGAVSKDYTTQNYNIDDTTPLTINVQFLAQFFVQTFNYADGSTVTGSADYGYTASLDQVNVVDANGDPVSGVTFTSDSGTVYSVPEPTSAVLLTIGCASLLVRRRSSEIS